MSIYVFINKFGPYVPYFIALVIKFFIVFVCLRKIMSVRTVLVVFFSSFFTFIASGFVVVIIDGFFIIRDFLFLPFISMYYLVTLPLLEAVVGWMLLRENLLNSRYNTVKKFILLMVVSNIAGIIGGIIGWFVI